MTDLRNTVFEVYTSANGQAFFAFGKTGSPVLTLERKTDNSEVAIKRVTTESLVSVISRKLSQGFSSHGRPMYFDPVAKNFTLTHPDLCWGGDKWILAAEPDDIPEGATLVAQEMAKAPEALILPVEIDAWSKRQMQNTRYLVAFRDMPCWALVLAETAMKAGWVIRPHPKVAPPPVALPSIDHIRWGQWLSESFTEKQIVEAQALLGFDVRGLMQPKVNADPSRNLASLL